MTSAEEKAVLDYLATSRNSAFAAREICRRAGNRRMWEENPRWAMPILSRLLASGKIKVTPAGYYQLVRDPGL